MYKKGLNSNKISSITILLNIAKNFVLNCTRKALILEIFTLIFNINFYTQKTACFKPATEKVLRLSKMITEIAFKKF